MHVLWLAWLGVGCGNPNYPPANPLSSDFRACEVDEDCVIVELGCCDECNGGTAVAVRSGQEQAALDEYGQTGCNGVDCTLLACNPLAAECQSDLCVVDRSARKLDP